MHSTPHIWWLLAALAGTVGTPLPRHAALAVAPEPLDSTSTAPVVDVREWPPSVPPALVFNLPRCTGRWAHMVATLTSAGIPFARFDNPADAGRSGVDAHECSLFRHTECFPDYFDTCRDCSGGMVGCAVTHLRGWNASAGHDAAAPWQLFSEDDVVLEAGAAQRLVAAVEAAERRSPDWHVVFFAPTVPEHELAGLREWDGPSEFMNWTAACSQADAWTSLYALSNAGRAAALQRAAADGFDFPLDISVYKRLCGRGECFTQFGGVVTGTASIVVGSTDRSLTMNTSAAC